MAPSLDFVPFPRLVFVDGFAVSENRQTSPSPAGRRWREAPDEGVYVAGIADAMADPYYAAMLEHHLGRHADAQNHPFVAWNTASFAAGACIVVPPGTVVPDPISLVFVSTTGDAPRVTFPRNLIIAGEGSRLSLIEMFLSASEGVHLANAVTEIIAGPGAVIDYCKLVHQAGHSFHVSTAAISLGRDASLTTHSFILGSALTRHELRVALEGEGSECSLNGLFLADGDQLVDSQTAIDHRQPHTTSRELYKGILAGRGRGVFNGAIMVRKDAQKTDAVQHNRNLLLSESARINTKPQLEILANDVRCAHGASIGQIDQEALFYLKTRGLDERVARHVLIHGFASEILDGIRVPAVRHQLESRLDAWLERALEAA